MTVSSRSIGIASASRLVVVPASMMIEPSSGSSASAAFAMRSFSTVITASRAATRGLEPEPLDRDRTTVHASHHAGTFEHGQVTPDRLGGDGEIVRERDHVDPTVGTSPAQDLLLAFLGVHVLVSPPFHLCFRFSTPGYFVGQ